MKSALLIAPAHRQESVFGGGRWEILARRTRLTVMTPEEWVSGSDTLHDAEVIFTTWGMPNPTPAQLARLPQLKVVFYAAGSVQGFARAFLERGVTVVSAWQANAVPVAEFALAQILLSLKGYWRNVRGYRDDPTAFRTAAHGTGAYGETVALIGAGAVGRYLIGLLRRFQVQVIVFDPFLSDAEANALGVEKVSLEDAFARGMVVSNHLADKPETAGLLNAEVLTRLRPGATFLNTGRGRTVVEDDLITLLTQRPDITALLDVTYPEPMAVDSPLRSLPNVQISTHIAGAIEDEVRRLCDLCLEEFDRYERGEPLRHAVTLAMLEHMA